MLTVPGYLADRVRRPVPKDSFVVEGSTPVVCFGDLRTARIATVGLNPSDAEFKQANVWLAEGERRLETLHSLGVETLESADDEAVNAVIAGCYGYFHRNPYVRWFRPLDRILTESLGQSYYTGGAVHLDLVQWATKPVWGGIKDVTVRDRLICADREFLRAQLAIEQIELVLMNGRSILDQIKVLGVSLRRYAPLVGGRPSDEILVGEHGSTTYIGWNKAFPHGGISTLQREQIIDTVRRWRHVLE